MSLDLVSAAELAKAMGVSRTYVNRLAQNGGLPNADGTLNSGQRVWLRETLNYWASENGRTLHWP